MTDLKTRIAAIVLTRRKAYFDPKIVAAMSDDDVVRMVEEEFEAMERHLTLYENAIHAKMGGAASAP